MNDTHEHPDNVDDLMVKTQNLMLLRQPFPERLISKLPKPTRSQTDEVKADFKKGARCEICGGWHHPKVVHLDYVGHAALTDRLLDADLFWSWEPVAWDEQGLPRLDKLGGLWLRLTVCGRTMLGYGSAPGKEGGDAIKELIGDGLRNAAMRMGGALELWFKGDLHPPEDDPKKPPEKQLVTKEQAANIVAMLTEMSASEAEFLKWLKVDKIENIQEDKYKTIIAALEARRKRVKA